MGANKLRTPNSSCNPEAIICSAGIWQKPQKPFDPAFFFMPAPYASALDLHEIPPVAAFQATWPNELNLDGAEKSMKASSPGACYHNRAS